MPAAARAHLEGLLLHRRFETYLHILLLVFRVKLVAASTYCDRRRVNEEKERKKRGRKREEKERRRGEGKRGYEAPEGIVERDGGEL